MKKQKSSLAKWLVVVCVALAAGGYLIFQTSRYTAMLEAQSQNALLSGSYKENGFFQFWGNIFGFGPNSFLGHLFHIHGTPSNTLNGQNTGAQGTAGLTAQGTAMGQPGGNSGANAGGYGAQGNAEAAGNAGNNSRTGPNPGDNPQPNADQETGDLNPGGAAGNNPGGNANNNNPPDNNNPGDNGGNPSDNGGTPGDNGGNPGDNGGNPSDNGGNPGDNGGNPGDNGGNPGGSTGGGPGGSSGGNPGGHPGGNNVQYCVPGCYPGCIPGCDSQCTPPNCLLGNANPSTLPTANPIPTDNSIAQIIAQQDQEISLLVQLLNEYQTITSQVMEAAQATKYQSVSAQDFRTPTIPQRLRI